MILKEEATFWWLKLEKLLACSISFVRKLKNQFTWNKQQKKAGFNYAVSVNITYFLSVLPQFEQIKEVCLHAGHASVHMIACE